MEEKDKYDKMTDEELKTEFFVRCEGSALTKRSKKYMKEALRRQDENFAILKTVSKLLS